jgi:CRP/FNR family transcriptional regulator, dissimilatory nitrate respiration regulator
MEFLDLVPDNVRNAISSNDLVAGQTLFLEKDTAEAFYALEFGQIRLLHYAESGQSVLHYFVEPGESFAEVTLFSDTYLCTAIAEVPSRVFKFPKQSFLEALQQDINLSSRMMEQLALRLHKAKILITTRSIRSARDRVLHYLQIAAQPDRTTVTLERPLKEIAEEIGISPEALSRALRELQQQGIITRTRNTIIFSI